MRKILIILFLFLICPILCLAEQIDINSATLSQLDEITHVGPKTAQKIIDGRPYSSVHDLNRVKGIGNGKYLQDVINQGFACVNCQTEITQTQRSTQETSNTNATATELNIAINEQTKESPTEKNPAEVGPPPTYLSGVVINEILPSPEGPDEENEWIELYNKSGTEINLSGWQIKDATGTITTFIVPKHLSDGRQVEISAYGYLVLERSDTKITLNNTTDGLFLCWPNGEIIDSVYYEKAPANQSYNRTEKNWQWSLSLTPGVKNKIIQNKEEQKLERLPKIEKSDNSKETNQNLATISQSISEQDTKSENPWFLFLTALTITIISAVIVLVLKIKINSSD